MENKTCVACAHCRFEAADYYCARARRRVPLVDPVTGVETPARYAYKACRSERAAWEWLADKVYGRNRCGPEGRNFVWRSTDHD